MDKSYEIGVIAIIVVREVILSLLIKNAVLGQICLIQRMKSARIAASIHRPVYM